MRGSSSAGTKRLGSARFEPRSATRTTSRTNAVDRVRTSRIRTSPITRDSVLKRYNKVDRSAASLITQSGTQPGKSQPGRGQRLRGEAKTRTKTREASVSTKTALAPLTPKQQRGKSERAFDALTKKDAKLAGKVDKAAFDSARLSDVSLKVGLNVGLVAGGAGVGFAYYDDDFASPNPYYGPSYDCSTDYNFWNSYGCWSLGYTYYWCYPYTGSYSYGYSNCYPSWYGYRSRYCGGLPYYYSSFYAGYYNSYDDDEYEDGFEEGYGRGFDSGLATGGEVVQEGEGVISTDEERGRAATGTRLVPSSSEVNKEALTRAAAHYLSVGDGAFLDKRYGDAVHFYAKAIEFAPDEGVLYLILSDALFATGDYHYAAYALRKALELDPALMEAIDDKHSFYKDPADFDQQVAVLELFLEDHYVDDDARLLLASNYLFGNRPAAAVDLLENSFSKSVRESQSGQLILAAAKSIQYGTPSTD